MIKLLDNFLNKITMYKLVLYVLIGLMVVGLVLSFCGILAYNPWALLFSIFFITTVCLSVNILFAWVFKAPTNIESAYITAFILVLLINPPNSPEDVSFFALAFWASVLAMASKYILAIKKKHVFNPVAISIVITAFVLNLSASWWVGTLWMMPFVLISGIMITRKIRRFDLVLSFIGTAFFVILLSRISLTSTPETLLNTFLQVCTSTPLLFFSFIMLTEPLTTPPTRKLRIRYGILTGFLFAPFVHVGFVYSTPELSLVVTNIFSYIVSPKQKLLLHLKQIVQIAHDTYDFVFRNDTPIKFKPGQYLEWTLEHEPVDSRGNRRYFTISSSPTESDIRMGVKMYKEPSSFKQTLHSLKEGDVVVASQLAGDFTMPNDKSKKLVFIAGGIGVTPFRSMIKYLIDTNERRDIVVLYSNRTVEDIAYKELFDEAVNKLSIRIVYVISDSTSVPVDWSGKTGFIDEKMIKELVPDLKERIFYISGPNSMVVAFSKTLSLLGVSKTNIKKDFFPGFA